MPVSHNYPTRSSPRLRAWICLPLLAAFTPTAYSANTSDEMEQLLSLLHEQTLLATQTRLNTDYVPGILTVLHGDQLERRGISSVWEALALVPGIENGLDDGGRMQLVVRGLGRTFASGNVKILLNGIAMNDAQLGYASPTMEMPVTQIERIEVIRGPGSAVHGEYAYSGVVNIISRKNEQRINLRSASGRQFGIGLIGNKQSESGQLAMDINLSIQGERGLGVNSGEDILYREGYGERSNAPGSTNEARESHHLLLGMRYRDTQLQIYSTKQANGDHFGINFQLSPTSDHLAYRRQTHGLKLQHEQILSEKLESHLHLGWMSQQLRSDSLYAGYYFEEGYGIDDLLGPDWVDSDYEEQRSYLGADLIWRGWARQQWLLGWQYNHITIKNSHLRVSDEAGSPWYDAEHPLYPSGTRRQIQSLTLQNEIRLNDPLTLTLGLRHDHYTDMGSSTTPRIAAVWRLSPQHILKAQYAAAFRPPSFMEMAGAFEDQELSPGTSHNYEIGYIYKGLESEWHLTLFRTEMRNITLAGYDEEQVYGYRNTNANQQGIELEWKQELSPSVLLDSNISWLHSRDQITQHPLAGSNRLLGNIGLEYRPHTDWQLNVDYRYTGSVWRDVNDSRPPLAGYSLLHASLSRQRWFETDTTLRLGVRNLLDRKTYQPAPNDTYSHDLPRPGRTWWLSVQHNF